MPQNDVDRKANSVDKEQSDQNLHCLFRQICPNI